MSKPSETSGSLDGSTLRIGIVAARFNGRLVESLVAGATDCLTRHGVAPEAIHIVRVPGAWEIPFALELLARSDEYQGLVALGLVIRGETPHFDYVCRESSAGVARVSRQFHLPVGFGILTCDTTAQAQERCGGKAGNKGWDAAAATLEMANLAASLAATVPQDG